MKFFEVTICTSLLLCSARSLFFTPVVETEQGLLRGIRAASGINKYYGIQYATSERFQPPKKPKKWSGIYNAINPLTACAQRVDPLVFITNEDCLYLDVYTPKNAKPGDKLPVFVFIHGGSYFGGSKIGYDPEFIVDKNIVAVTINYRLGVLGFLCVNGIANLGLKDQTAALRWVQKNIASFGGDRDHVTLAGESAGATSTSLHMLSEQSAGLFHKAILLSGFALTPWAFNVDPVTPALKDANKISVAQTEEDIYNVFAKTPIRELLTVASDIPHNSRNYKYAPCVDSHLPDPFFRDTPYEIIKSGHYNKVPVMIGVTNREGILFYGTNTMTGFAHWNADFNVRLPAVFSCPKDRKRIGHKMRAYYFGKRPITEKALKSVVSFYSDWIDHATFDAFSQLLANYSQEPVYKYVFSYDGGRNFAKVIFGNTAAYLSGASHADDLFYLFKPAGLPLPILGDDKLFIDRFSTMVANFIKYSDPTPHTTRLLPLRWPSSTADASYIMHLNRHLKVTSGPWKKDRFFLSKLCHYGLKGFVPCESTQQCYPDARYSGYVFGTNKSYNEQIWRNSYYNDSPSSARSFTSFLSDQKSRLYYSRRHYTTHTKKANAATDILYL